MKVFRFTQAFIKDWQ